eukprot:3862193-Rhodomonas_salina.1
MLFAKAECLISWASCGSNKANSARGTAARASLAAARRRSEQGVSDEAKMKLKFFDERACLTNAHAANVRKTTRNEGKRERERKRKS